jgi:hypothetical protein
MSNHAPATAIGGMKPQYLNCGKKQKTATAGLERWRLLPARNH